MSKIEIFMFVSLTMLFSCFVYDFFHVTKTPEFTDDNCIQAVVGEMANGSYENMKILAHAIRNRKTLRGVYGFYAAHIRAEGKETWATASCAWFDSLNEFDPIQGAYEWRSLADVQKHGHPKGMWPIKLAGGNFYYKPKPTER